MLGTGDAGVDEPVRTRVGDVAADLAAAVNPLLVRTRDTIAYLVERAADEAAAATVGSRRQAALALADVALSAHRPDATDQSLLAFHGHGVVSRVAALQRPLIPSMSWLAGACLLGACSAVLAVGDATLALGRVIEALTNS